MRLLSTLVALVLLLLALPDGTAVAAEKSRLRFSGGPPGGTFEIAARGLTQRINEQRFGTEVTLAISGGSVENLRRVNSGEADFAIVYAGDLLLAGIGQLPYDNRIYDQVLAVATLYAAPAQLLVRANSTITGVEDLASKRVAVGGIGSGTAATAQRFFTSVGLWDRIKPDFSGYQDAISALGHGYVDAIWVFSGIPTSAVTQAAKSFPVRLLDLAGPADQSGFYRQYPFFTRTLIPADTYPQVNQEVATFQDLAIWVAGSHVSAATVEQALAAALREAALIEGRDGILTPLHPGAETFWNAVEQP
ncbi:TAXI family TRAP transporter solute-binding subunit [Geoalkalibacter halelectricus]|uniref:TAXI family TRAP transporter solute-binding subunit n=1 Tax=Geoalkalibacter halelectricus TaxID=2847045 RepID=UPI003D1B1754